MEIAYIRGFFDRQCNVDVDTRAITLTTDQVQIARQMASALHQARIQCATRAMGLGRVKLRVSSRESLLRWKTLVGFEDQDKRERLDRILASYGGLDAQRGFGAAQGEGAPVPADVSRELRGKDRGDGTLPLHQSEAP